MATHVTKTFNVVKEARDVLENITNYNCDFLYQAPTPAEYNSVSNKVLGNMVVFFEEIRVAIAEHQQRVKAGDTVPVLGVSVVYNRPISEDNNFALAAFLHIMLNQSFKGITESNFLDDGDKQVGKYDIVLANNTAQTIRYEEMKEISSAGSAIMLLATNVKDSVAFSNASASGIDVNEFKIIIPADDSYTIDLVEGLFGLVNDKTHFLSFIRNSYINRNQLGGLSIK